MEEYYKRFNNEFLIISDEIDLEDNNPCLNINFDDSNLNDKLPHIPEHIKYIQLSCEPIHYVDIPKLLSSSSLECVTITMPLSGIFNHNMLDYIKLSKSIRALKLVIDNDIKQTADKQVQDAIDLIIKKSIIPLDIEYLSINFHLSNINEYTNLKTFVIIGEIQNEDYNYSLDNLPESLEWLEIHPIGFNQPVNNLPVNLKVLIFGQNRVWNYYNGYQHSIDNLPHSLEVLYLPEFLMLDDDNIQINQSNQSNQSILENLPPNLRILSIPQYMPDNINYNSLPDSIEIIYWFNFPDCYKEISRFPASLKKIQIKYDNDEIKQYFTNAPFVIEVQYCSRIEWLGD